MPPRAQNRHEAIARAAVDTGAWYRIVSQSMFPALPEGCRVRLESYGEKEPLPGHIVAFVGDEDLRVHRVVAVRWGDLGERHIITRGDNMPTPDPPWEYERLIGKVVDVDGRRPALLKSLIWLTRRQIAKTLRRVARGQRLR